VAPLSVIVGVMLTGTAIGSFAGTVLPLGRKAARR
jgi:hypothetical protein